VKTYLKSEDQAADCSILYDDGQFLYRPNWEKLMMKRIWIVFFVFGLSACSTHFDTSKKDGVDGLIIYKLSQEQAFNIAYNAISTVLPGRKISKIDGPVKGYSTWSRFVLDTYTQQVTVIPANGRTENGVAVEGFYFEISGAGTSGSGRMTNVTLYETIQENLNQLSVAATVTRIERGTYSEPVFKNSSNSIEPLGSRPATVEERLGELKTLFDRGLITEQEYNVKREAIIQSL